ncbi:MAG TPA: alginate lyase family protein [Burkholderiales bacterium]|nr:alginate lyase family protein [Burkholderiales bacterium]
MPMSRSQGIGNDGVRLSAAAVIAGIRERLRWYFNRLRCMTPSEIPRRVLRALTIHAERAGLIGSQRVPSPDLAPAPHCWIHTEVKVDAAPYLDSADRIAAGKLDVFSLRDADLGSPPRWNRDPKTGVEAPLSFGKGLDYRNPRLVGDIKYLWEPNRHLHLVTLAQAHVLSGNDRYFHVLRQHLESWFDACPYPMGPNWTSALEAGIRLINWSVAWQLLGGAHSPLFQTAEGARLRKRWLESVYRHMQFVCGHFSLDSSANNHLIGEAAGLFIAALSWPHWPCTGDWLTTAKAILEREALLQNAPDGVNREQAVSYQQFVLDLLLLTLLSGKANGQWFSVNYESRIEVMLEYLASIMDAGGNVPMMGDSDDALAVRLAAGGDFSPYRSLLASGAILFGRGDFKLKAGVLDDKTRWLMGMKADELFDEQCTAETRLPLRQAFPEGGYYILGCDFEDEDEIRLIVDAGPLGYQTIAAHGHADALAFTLSVGGMEFLIDPGTFAYHTEGSWRRYFRGTSAHNTLCVDGQDQSQSGGNFMWLRKARAGCKVWSSAKEKDLFEGWQDGFMWLTDPVMHQRRIVLDKVERRVVIEDSLRMVGEHDIELFFHCSERCEVSLAQDGFALRQERRTLSLKLPVAQGAAAQIHRGSTAPILGWISREFDRKLPAPTIAWRARLKGNVVLRTEIVC